MNKKMSMLVCVCICLTLIFSTLNMSGVQLAGAANVRNELWLVAGCNTALVNNTTQLLSEEYDLSPYKYETGTLYLPLSIAAAIAVPLPQKGSSTVSPAKEYIRISLFASSRGKGAGCPFFVDAPGSSHICVNHF